MLEARQGTQEGLEIFDEGGKPLGRVTLPTDPRLIGADRGTVYLNRMPQGFTKPGEAAHAA